MRIIDCCMLSINFKLSCTHETRIVIIWHELNIQKITKKKILSFDTLTWIQILYKRNLSLDYQLIPYEYVKPSQNLAILVPLWILNVLM